MKFAFNIYTIKYFVKVAELGNITNAAMELFITQPTLSRQLASLEDTLGTPLLKRVRGGVELTEAGKSFYQSCVKFLAAYDEFMNSAYQFQDMKVGNLKIGYQKSSEELLVRLHKYFLRANTQVNITNVRQGSTNFIDMLQNKELDFAYLYAPELEGAPRNIISIPVWTLRYMALVSADNPIASKPYVEFNSLARQPLILPSKSNSPRKLEHILAAFKKAGLEPNIAGYATQIMDYVMKVVQYNGVTILPYMHNVEEEHQIEYRELRGYDTDYPICLAWSSDNMNPLIQTYSSFVRKQMKEQEQKEKQS